MLIGHWSWGYTLSSDRRIIWMIRVPRRVRERRHHADQLMLVVKFVLENVSKGVSPCLTVYSLDWENVKRSVTRLWLQWLRQEHVNLRLTALKWADHSVR